MWWLIPVGIAGAAAAIYGYFSSQEREARERWERDRERVERSIEEHRENIEQHIAAAKHSYNFKFLIDLHYSSFRVADEAWRLKRDAESSTRVMRKMVDDAKARRRELRQEQRSIRDRNERARVDDEVKLLTELIDRVLPDLQAVSAQKREFSDELARLNEQTRMLKEAIRDRCGSTGREWYERLDERRRQRRS